MENFKEIPGYHGRYLIGDQGSVKSLKTNRVLTTTPGSSGYPQVTLSHMGKNKTIMVHRMVAQAFLPLIEGKGIVNHLNGNKADARACNLEWTDYSGNSLHAQANGLTPPPPAWAKGKFGADHNRSKRVYAYSAEGKLEGEYEGLSEASRALGIGVSTIGEALKNGSLTRKTNGFFFYKKVTRAEFKQVKQTLKAKLDKRGSANKQAITCFDKEGKQVGEYIGMEAAAAAYKITRFNVMDSVRYGSFNRKAGVRFVRKSP